MHFVKEDMIARDDETDPSYFETAFRLHRERIRAFCAIFEKKLLPEIREIVYEHLLAACTTQYVLESHAHRNYCHSCTSYFFSRSRMPIDPGSRCNVWRFSEYTGDVIGREIAVAWYRNARFMVYLGDGLVNDWLSKDVWDRGIVPAELVRDVRIHVPEASCDDLNSDKRGNKNTAGEELSMLTRLGNKRVDLMIELEVIRMGVLRKVADLVYELKSRGFVNVKVHAHCSINCKMRDNGYFVGLRKDRCSMGCKMRDIGYIFDVRKEVFENVFGEEFTELDESKGYGYCSRWRDLVLAGNQEAVVCYAEQSTRQNGAVPGRKAY
ncbi:hypothetical protein DE146DRAFT_179344 [Phaeosphaeria sp. MPI-PUGE-AT-0046c]|nr:hypothetical protein DE146DRAFT_179344 [Phaeosphaeria sp. MPI-PUGE-AT-0046c]